MNNLEATNSSALFPEEKLCQAVIEKAIDDLRRERFNGESFRTALWFFRSERSPFEWMQSALKIISPDRLRAYAETIVEERLVDARRHRPSINKNEATCSCGWVSSGAAKNHTRDLSQEKYRRHRANPEEVRLIDVGDLAMAPVLKRVAKSTTDLGDDE